MTNSLIFDIEISGHHSEYLKHVLEFLLNNNSDGSFVLIVHPEFTSRIKNYADRSEQSQNVVIKAISLKEYHDCKKGNLLLRSIKTFKMLEHYVKIYTITKVYLLYFNIFQFALSIFQYHFEITGILFSPYYRLEYKNYKGKIEYFRKYFQTKLFIQKKQIKKIFILNDATTALALNRTFKTNKFQMLPDPVPELTPLRGFSVRNIYKISSERKLLLHFGSLSGRKGTFDILDSFKYLSENDLRKTALILAGKATPSTDFVIKGKISQIISKYPYAFIIYKNEFVSESLMKSYFDQCDFVLVPYKNIESSSGIIGHAIASGKPVIGTKKGLLGDLIMNNKLGILIDESSPELIAESIHQAIESKLLTISNSKYLREHTPELFASTLFNAKQV
jgi:glycosyltransferase involved in cell wall biosynthesis